MKSTELEATELSVNSRGYKPKGTAQFVHTSPIYESVSSKSRIIGYRSAGDVVTYLQLSTGFDSILDSNRCELWIQFFNYATYSYVYSCAKRSDHYYILLEQ